MPDESRLAPEHTLRFAVRSYELDQNGHVNNAIYVAWAENVTNEHAEAIGFGREWSLERGGGWVVRRHEATFHVPAVAGDQIEATVRVEGVRGVRLATDLDPPRGRWRPAGRGLQRVGLGPHR